jgi:uncharacterized membrane protein
MPKKQKQPRETRAEARKREMERRHERNVKVMKEAVAVIVVVAVLAVIALALSRGGSAGLQPSQAATTTGSAVTIPVSDLSATAKFYTYDSGGTKVRFFAIRDADGSVHVATDACDVCYASKKGYHQDGTDMVCNNCGKHFSVQSIGTANTAGGCWPSFVKMRVDGGNAVVEGKDLAAKAYLFK